MDARRVHVSVRGHVQGVGYRYATRHAAEVRGVSGWVRNRRDGTVEAALEGSPTTVVSLLAWMRHGPPGAAVDDLVAAEETPIGVRGFEILRTE
ncbi:acylphosphatase [Microbacterium resistens]